jgi:hypothetical protein
METKTPLQKPDAEKVILLLIKEELKNRKLFDDLRLLGYFNTFYQSDLIDVIMLATGLTSGSSLQRSTCHTLLDRHSQRVVADARELMDEARQVYDTLLRHAEVHRRREGPQSTVHGPQ